MKEFKYVITDPEGTMRAGRGISKGCEGIYVQYSIVQRRQGRRLQENLRTYGTWRKERQ